MTLSAKVEVFVDGSPRCEDVVRQVKELACSKCEVIVYNLNDPISIANMANKASDYGIENFPAVTINGKLVEIDKLKNVKASHS
ncbi:glutaredoxin [Cohnella cholangitidis]|uniref:Glutaredoxin n=1 Tax=Cohnella cholangitidis TaxID=2598458 RepID=A0A7G5C5Q9_9BACL|nr:glutaredoxin [Cohnella cholangitidis]